MKLWTIKDNIGYNQLRQNKILRGSSEYVDDDFRRSYNWMIKQMKKRLKIPMPDESAYPIWAWYQWNGINKKRPDLRSNSYAKRGSKLYRIEFEIEDDKVVLSDFDLFHFVLNYWYLPSDEKDDNLFNDELDKNKIRYINFQTENKSSKTLNKYISKIEKSWDKIFDLDWHSEYITSPKDEKSIQATLWELQWDQVINVKEFIAK